MKVKFKKIISMLLIAAMILSSNGFLSFAESVDDIVESNIGEEKDKKNYNESTDDVSELSQTQDETEYIDEDVENNEISEDEIDLEESEDETTVLSSEVTEESDEKPEEESENVVNEEYESNDENNDSEQEIVQLEELIETADDAEFEELLNENKELVEYLRSYDITVENSSVIKFFKDLELREDGPYLNAKYNGHWYLADDRFVSRYNPYNSEEFNLLGAGPNEQTITLVFGVDKPLANLSSNWENTHFGVLASANPESQYEVVISADAGTVLTSVFDEIQASDPGTAEFNRINYGLGYHVELPRFRSIWDGFEFEGWVDEEGVNLFTSQNGTFNYIMQYDKNVVYTAKWKKVTTGTHRLNISYFRATYSSAFKTPFVESKNIINHPLVATFNEIKNHGEYIYLDPEEVAGYKITKVKISTMSRASGMFRDEGSRSLLTSNVDKSKYIVFDADTDLKMNATTYNIDGCIPNHDIFIEYYYEPDESKKSIFKVSYVSEAGEELRVSHVQNVAVEEIINSATISIPRYQYLRTEVEETPVIYAGHVFGLGYYHCANECFTSSAVNDSRGKFKAVMPNQDVSIKYYYELGGMDTTTYIRKEIEQLDGTYMITTESITHPVGSANVQEYSIENKEDEGYGVPVPGFVNVTLDSWVYPGGDTFPDGTLKFFVDNDRTPVITLVYGLDYTSDYWTKLGFFYDDAGHGSIAPAAGSKDFNNRYVHRGESYTVNELTKEIDSTADTNYRLVWYKNRTSGVGATGEPLSGDILVDEANFNLFAAFEEDPDSWVDIQFTSADNCYITGTSTYHLVKGTAVGGPGEANCPPTVNANTGYSFVKWVDENGADLGTTYSASHIYTPVITSNFPGSTSPVRPVANVTYASDGKGTAHIFGVYPGRKYVLTNRNGRILKISESNDALANGFDNLTQGTTYKLYEVLGSVTLPAVGGNIPSGSGVSEAYTFGIKALNTAPTVTNNADGTNTINVTVPTGLQYALLDDRYNIVHNWGTSGNYSGLSKGTYYLIVARASSDDVEANSDDAIRNGEVVYTRKNDLSSHNYRLLIIGDDAYAQSGAGSVTSVTFAGMNAKLYSVEAGSTVQVRSSSAANYKTKVLTGNVSINESQTSHSFHMPNQDVIIYDVLLPDTAKDSSSRDVENTLTLYNDKESSSLIKLADIKTELNSKSDIATAISNTCIVKHHLVMHKYATKKSVVTSLGSNNGKVAPYEYSFDVQTVVLGLPYPNSITSNTNGVVSFESGMVGNSDFALNSGSITWPYDSDESNKGSASFGFASGINNAVSINYIKKHKVNVSCTTTGIEFNNDFYIPDGGLISSSTDYATLAARLHDLFDNSTPDSEKKEYLYQNITDSGNVFNPTNTNIGNPKNLVLNYTLNSERETKKTNLSTEIASAQAKYDSLTDETVKNVLLAAINVARSVRTEQATHPYTVDELEQAIQTLKAAKDAAVDPAAGEGDSFTIAINGNGGNVNVTSITVTIGDSYKYESLASVTANRSQYTFKEWNTSANGSGTKITPESIVGSFPSDTLYAIWNYNGGGGSVPRGGGGGVGGGGGGGGGGRGGNLETIINDQKLFDEINVGNVMFGKNSYGDSPIVGKTVWVTEDLEKGRFFLYDPNTNKIELKIGNKTTLESIANEWVVVNDIYKIKKTYRTDENGNAIIGKYATEDGNVYYLSDQPGENYGSLVTGWIVDPVTHHWYYSSPQTGSLITGWNTIDGQDYYFIKPDVKVTNNINQDDLFTKQIYGMMLADVETLDGFTIDSNGHRVKEKPYLVD